MTVEPPPAPPPEQPPPPPPPPRPRLDPRALRVALGRGALAFAIVLLVAEVITFVGAVDAPDLSVADTARVGGFLFSAFHHIGIGADLPPISLEGLLGGGGGAGLPGDAFGGAGGIGASGSVAVAMLLGTGLVFFLLYRGGRAAAAAGGGTIGMRLGAGALPAVPYAFLSLVLAAVSGFQIELPADAEPVIPAGSMMEVGPGLVPAFLWPLVIGGIAGALGGLSAARELLAEQPRGREASAVLGGTARMLTGALVAAGLMLVVLSAANPGTFVEYFRGVGEAGLRGGLLLVLFTALLVPNFMVLLAFLGMGSGLVVGDYVGTNAVRVLSLPAFPTGAEAPGFDPEGAPGGFPFDPGAVPLPFETAAAPPEWWAAVAVPLAAVLWGGWWVARAARSRGHAAGLGALAGVGFAAALIGLAILAGIGFRFEISFVFQQAMLGRAGPSILGGTALALLWGAGGGALGGLLGARRRVDEPPPPAEVPG